jgi:sugar lactone lactonase YvrE
VFTGGGAPSGGDAASGGGAVSGGGAPSGGGATSGGGGTPATDATDAPVDATPTPEATATTEATTAPTETATPSPSASPTSSPTASPSAAATPTPSPTATPRGTFATWVGNGTAGYAEGTLRAARFNLPYGVAVDGAGNVYIADAFNHRIRKVTPQGVVTTIAGSGQQGHADGAGASARFNSPLDIAAQADGTLFVADTLNHCIRKVTPQGVVTTLAGSPEISYDALGYPLLSYPSGIAVTASGTVYVADPGLQAIRVVSSSGAVTNLAGQYWDDEGGLADGTGTNAKFQEPMDVALDRAGNLFVADTSNHRIRKVTPQGVVTTVAGSGEASVWGGAFADGLAGSARFNHPYGLAVDATGDLYIADKDNQRIRKLAVNGMVSTPAGSGTAGFLDGAGGSARVNGPVGLAFDSSGKLYVADTLNHAVRVLYP